MRIASQRLAVVVGVALAAAASPATARAAGDDAVCAATCARTESLHCRNQPTCVARCEEMRATPVCRAPMQAVLRCFSTLPVSRWECSDDGLPAVKEGECDHEQAAFVRCLGGRS